jgi:hypothetical protein
MTAMLPFIDNKSIIVLFVFFYIKRYRSKVIGTERKELT